MAVRAVALGRFGVSNLQHGQPMAVLEEVLVPLYLRHRYQLEAVSKLIGGVNYAYNVRGDTQELPTPVLGSIQRQAVNSLLAALTPKELSLPEHITTQIPPRPPGYGPHRELFSGHTGPVFDPYAPAAVVAQQIVGLLLNPARTARLTYQADFNKSLPELLEVLVTFTQNIWLREIPTDPYEAELQRQTQQVWVDGLLSAAASPAQ